MASPTTPLALSPFRFPAGPWRPSSVPLDPTSVRSRVCGLLNKVATANVDRIAERFADLAISAGRSGDSATVETCAQMLVQRCVVDPRRIGLLARLVQRAADEVEGEGLRWRSVDPYYLEDPATSFPTALRATILRELEAALRGNRGQESRALSGLVGELLVIGVVSCDDMQDIVTPLFAQSASNSNEHCVILCRMLEPIITSTEASHLIGSLLLVQRIESVLEEDTISFKIRYMMMNILDHCLFPRPRDVFGSDRRRSEAYGFPDDADEAFSPDSSTLVDQPSSKASAGKCARYARTLFTTRNVIEGGQYFSALEPAERNRFTSILISSAMSSGDDADAALVASFLALPSVRRALQAPNGHMAKAFEPEVVILEETVLDFPSAYRNMATMLHAADLPRPALEDLVSRIVIAENAARDRLLEEVASFGVGGDDLPDELDGGAGDTSCDESSASEYAYAY